MQISHGSFLLGLLIGAACASGAAFLFFAGDGGQQTARAAPLSAGPTVANAAHPQQVGEDWSSAGDESQRTSVAQAPSSKVAVEVDPGRVDHLLAQQAGLESTRTTGTGSIWGVVRDTAGAGLAGVIVRARGSGNTTPRAESSAAVGSAAPALHDLEEALRLAVDEFQESRANLHESTCDANGAYRFADLPEGTWTLDAYLRDWVISSVAGARDVALESQVDFEAKPVVSVQVAVLLPNGSAASTAVIQCSGEGYRERNFAWSPAEPSLRLTPGHFDLVALSGEIATPRGGAFDLKSEPQTIELDPVAPAPALRFELEGRAGVRGRLSMPRDGITGDTPRVFLLPLGQGAEPDLAALGTSEQNAYARSGQEFAFLDLLPGHYVVGASRSWSGEILTHAVVEVRDTIVRQDLTLPPFDPTKHLIVAVTDSEGRSLSDVEFSYRHEYANGSSSGGVQKLRTADDHYVILFGSEMHGAYFSEESSKDEFSLEISHKKHGSKSVALQPGQTELQVSFTSPARVEVTVAGFAQSSLQGRLSVALVRESEDQSHSYSRRGDEQPSSGGLAVFEAVEAGQYVLHLRLQPKSSSGRYSGSSQSLLSQPVTLVPGENALQVALPALYELVVSFPDGEEGTTFQLSPGTDGNGQMRAELDAEKRVLFPEVAAGHYTLQCWSPYAQMEIDVPCGVVIFQPRVVNALRVRILDAAGALATAGLLDDDLIVALDGEEFETEEDVFALYRRKKPLALTVLRAGQRLDLAAMELSMRDFDPDAMGGSLEPTSR